MIYSPPKEFVAVVVLVAATQRNANTIAVLGSLLACLLACMPACLPACLPACNVLLLLWNCLSQKRVNPTRRRSKRVIVIIQPNPACQMKGGKHSIPPYAQKRRRDKRRKDSVTPLVQGTPGRFFSFFLFLFSSSFLEPDKD